MNSVLKMMNFVLQILQDAEVVINSAVFALWVKEVDKDPKLFVEDIHIQSIDMFGSRVGFVKFKTTAKVNVGGERGVIDVPGIVFMRGGAVGILVILECDGEEYVFDAVCFVYTCRRLIDLSL